MGYSGSRALSRAFSRRLGPRPSVYRELGGRLSPEIARRGKAGLPPLTPRFVAAVTALAREVGCARCGAELGSGSVPRVFEDLAPICDGCARQRAPELAALLG